MVFILHNGYNTVHCSVKFLYTKNRRGKKNGRDRQRKCFIRFENSFGFSECCRRVHWNLYSCRQRTHILWNLNGTPYSSTPVPAPVESALFSSLNPRSTYLLTTSFSFSTQKMWKVLRPFLSNYLFTFFEFISTKNFSFFSSFFFFSFHMTFSEIAIILSYGCFVSFVRKTIL